MALPRQLPTTNFAMEGGNIYGQLFASSDTVYVIGSDTANDAIDIYSSTDPANTAFAVVDATGNPGSNTDGAYTGTFHAHGWHDSTSIHVIAMANTNIEADKQYSLFHDSDHGTTPDEWDGTTINETAFSTGSGSNYFSAFINAAGVRSDGDILWTACSDSENIMGTDYSRATIHRREGGTWTTNVHMSTVGKTAVDEVFPVGVIGASDRLNCTWVDATNGVLYRSIFDSGNTFDSQGTSLDTGLPTSYPGTSGRTERRMHTGTSLLWSSTRKIRITYEDSSGSLSVVGWDDDGSTAAPTASIVAAGLNDNANVDTAIINSTGDVQHILYTRDSGDLTIIYYTKTGASNDTWDADSTEFDSTTTVVLIDAKIFDYGGGQVLGYVYYDNGAEYYNEKSIGLPPSGTGAQTLQLLTQAGVGVMDPEGTGAQTLQLLTQAGVGVMHPEGTGAQTLQLLVQAGTGALEISGTGAQTLEQLIQDATGSHTLSATGTGVQTLELLTQSGAGLEDIIGSSAQTLELLTQAGVGVMHPEGTGAQTLELLTQVGSGLEDIIGSAAQTLELLTQVGSGTHTPGGGPVTSTGAQTLELLAQAGVGVMHPEGTGAQTLELLTQAASGAEEMSATAAQTLELLQQAGAGEQLNPIGVGAQTLQLLTQTASAIEAISGAGAQTLQLLTQDGAGTHGLSSTGTGAQTLQLLAQAGVGLEDISATAAQTLQLLTQAGAGEQLNPIGTGAQVLEILTQSANAQLDIIGSAAQTLQTLRQESSDFVPTAAQIMQVLTQNAQGVVLSIRLWVPETGITDTWVEEAPTSNTWTEEGEL